MLSILLQNNISPKPLKPNSIDGLIFAKDGKIKEPFIKLSQELGIDPRDLIYKNIEEFSGEGISEAIKILRYNHYENRRIAKIKALKAFAKEKNTEKLSEKASNDSKINDQINLPKLNLPTSQTLQRNMHLSESNNDKYNTIIGKVHQVPESNESLNTMNNKRNIAFKGHNSINQETKGHITSLETMNDFTGDNGLMLTITDTSPYSLENNFNRYVNIKVRENERHNLAKKKVENYSHMKELEILNKLKNREEKLIKERKNREKAINNEVLMIHLMVLANN